MRLTLRELRRTLVEAFEPTLMGCDVCGFGSVENIDEWHPCLPCSRCGEVALPLYEDAGGDYMTLVDQAMDDIMQVDKTLERAHQVAPGGAPKAIIMGLHQDVFQTIHTFRQFIRQLKGGT